MHERLPEDGDHFSVDREEHFSIDADRFLVARELFSFGLDLILVDCSEIERNDCLVRPGERCRRCQTLARRSGRWAEPKQAAPLSPQPCRSVPRRAEQSRSAAASPAAIESGTSAKELGTPPNGSGDSTKHTGCPGYRLTLTPPPLSARNGRCPLP